MRFPALRLISVAVCSWLLVVIPSATCEAVAETGSDDALLPIDPVNSTVAALPLPDLIKSVEKCSLKLKKSRVEAGRCAEETHELSIRRRLAKFEKQRVDALEALQKAQAVCDSNPHECTGLHRAQWVPISFRVPSANDVPFQEFFLHYAVDSRPAVVPFEPLISSSDVKLSDESFQSGVIDVLRLCGTEGCGVVNNMWPATIDLDTAPVLKAALAQLASVLQVPYFVSTDYFQRLAAIASRLEKEGDRMAKSTHEYYAKLWPSVYAAHHVALHTSPFSLHRVLVPLSGRLRVRVVNAEQVPFFYPTASGSFPEDVDLFHPNLTAYPALQLVSGVEAEIGAGQVLFVPSGSAVAWHTVDAHGNVIDDTVRSDPRSRAVVLEQCYLDASNLNRVKAELKILALQNAKLATLLAMLQAPELDTTLDRKAQDLPFKVFATWPRPASSNVRKLAEDVEEDGPGNGKGKAAGLKNRASRANRLKDWQEDKRWSLKVRQLAMAAPSSPLVVNAGRRNVTLSWHCPNEGGPHNHAANDTTDKAVKGYSVVWHAQSLGPEIETSASAISGNHITIEDLRAQVGIGVPSHNHTTDEELDVAQHSLLDFDVSSGADFLLEDKPSRLVVGCGGVSADVVCVTIPNLLPNHLYIFRVAAITELGKSTFSESSPTARTLMLSRPGTPLPPQATVKGAASVQLQVSPPQDTGGLPILGYAIVRQENWLGAYSEVVISPATHTSPQYIDVVGLVPATGYMFKIAAVNAAGVSNFSEPSNGVTTEINGDSSVTSIVGFGGVADSGKVIPKQEVETVNAVASLFVQSSGNVEPGLTVTSLLDRSGYGISPLAAADRSTATISGQTAESGSKPQPLSHSGGTFVAQPCLGPVVTVSDTKQTLQLHTKRAESFVAWAGHHCPRRYDVQAEIVASKPLSGARATNLKEFHRRVVYFERGDLSLRDKVHLAAKNGALAVVIGDNTGRCQNHEFTQVCVPGGDKRRNEGFAKTDPARFWEDAKIPVIVIEQADSERLKTYLM